MDGMLSQEEINALFKGMPDSSDGEDTTDSVSEPALDSSLDSGLLGDILTDIEKDAVGEISNISMGTAATTLNTLVGQPVNITTPKVSYGKWENLAADFKARPCVALQLGYKEGLNGDNILILKEPDVMVITDLMMGGDGSNTEGEVGELQLSAISEAMNQMMGSSATSLSSMINRKIDILPPVAKLINFNEDIDMNSTSLVPIKEFVKVSFKMTIGDLVDSEIMQLYPLGFAKTLYDMFAGGGDSSPASETPAAEVPVQEPQMQQPVPQPDMNAQQPMPNMGMQQPQPDMNMAQGMPGYGMPQGMPGYGMAQPMPGYGMPQGMPGYGMAQPMPGYGMPPVQPMGQPEVNVQMAQFQSFNNNVSPATQKENIEIIRDVPLEVTVELGKTTRSIKDILEFAPGTIIELNKIAGEPVDVLVNGKYVAKGEVVVIEESFGVRVTEIIK